MIGVSSLKKEISRLKDYGKAPKKLIRLENLLTQYNSILI